MFSDYFQKMYTKCPKCDGEIIRVVRKPCTGTRVYLNKAPCCVDRAKCERNRK